MNVPEPWSAVVLAAGAGERLGGLPKALLRIKGRTLIAGLLDALNQSGAQDIVVVLGHHADAIATVLPHRSGLRITRLATPGEQAQSLHQGLAAVSPFCPAVMVCLADQPLIDASAICALRKAYAARPASADMVVPWVNGAPGNPVMMSRAVVDELLASSDPQSGKAWRERHPQRLHRWINHNLAYRTDLDTEADVQRLRDAGWEIEYP